MPNWWHTVLCSRLNAHLGRKPHISLTQQTSTEHRAHLSTESYPALGTCGAQSRLKPRVILTPAANTSGRKKTTVCRSTNLKRDIIQHQMPFRAQPDLRTLFCDMTRHASTAQSAHTDGGDSFRSTTAWLCSISQHRTSSPSQALDARISRNSAAQTCMHFQVFTVAGQLTLKSEQLPESCRMSCPLSST